MYLNTRIKMVGLVLTISLLATCAIAPTIDPGWDNSYMNGSDTNCRDMSDGKTINGALYDKKPESNTSRRKPWTFKDDEEALH